MDKRLDKRHKRQVKRAKKQAQSTEPELRTLEQVKATREASQSPSTRRNDPTPLYAAGPEHSQAGPLSSATSKAEN